MNNKIIDTERKTPGEIMKMLCINFSFAFTLFMLFSMFFGMIYADEEARAGIMYCWTIAGAILLAVVLQLVFFTPLLIRRLNYGARIALFGVCFYAVLTPLAIAFGWFPTELPGAWLIWNVTYVMILALSSLLFTGLYRRETKLLNKQLERYKSETAKRRK